MIYNCLHCEKELVSARSSKKYCSDKCRVYYNRGVSVTKPIISVTNSVTELLQKANSLQTKAKDSVTEDLIYEKE
jgi:hypothetical protein